jgi:hypothetical protein
MAIPASIFLESNYGIIALIDMNWIHISDHDLERYYLGMVTAEVELAPLEIVERRATGRRRAERRNVS